MFESMFFQDKIFDNIIKLMILIIFKTFTVYVLEVFGVIRPC